MTAESRRWEARRKEGWGIRMVGSLGFLFPLASSRFLDRSKYPLYPPKSKDNSNILVDIQMRLDRVRGLEAWMPRRQPPDEEL
jgi:hypothetical protein